MENLFSERLKETRLSQGLTQKQLAEKAEMAVASYSSYEKGAKKPPLDGALRLAKALNVSLDWLCGYSRSKGVMKLETQADVMRVFLNMDSTGLNISVDEDLIPADADETLSRDDIDMLYQEHYQEIQALASIGESYAYDPGPRSSRAIFRISHYKLAKFFEKWSAIREQYRNGTIDEELYNLWCEKQLSEAQKIPLPFMYHKANAQNITEVNMDK